MIARLVADSECLHGIVAVRVPYMISFCYGYFNRVLRWLYWLKQSGPSLNAGRTNTTITYTQVRGLGKAAEACLSYCLDNLPIRKLFAIMRRSRATCYVYLLPLMVAHALSISLAFTSMYGLPGICLFDTPSGQSCRVSVILFPHEAACCWLVTATPRVNLKVDSWEVVFRNPLWLRTPLNCKTFYVRMGLLL